MTVIAQNEWSVATMHIQNQEKKEGKTKAFAFRNVLETIYL